MQAHDPVVKSLPGQYSAVDLCASALDAARGADALVIATEWPVYKDVSMSEILAVMHTAVILDANRFVAATVELLPGVTYVAVGKAVNP